MILKGLPRSAVEKFLRENNIEFTTGRLLFGASRGNYSIRPQDDGKLFCTEGAFVQIVFDDNDCLDYIMVDGV